jgi:hypothetical protein
MQIKNPHNAGNAESAISRRRFAKTLGTATLGTMIGRQLLSPGSAAASAAVETDVENTFTRTQKIVPSGGSEMALKLLSDDRAGTLVLGNVTAGQSPANTPGIILQKDGKNRWELSIDATPGSQGDFSLFAFTASADVVYITDEVAPGVGIGACDRNSARTAQLRIDNMSSRRPTLIVNPAQAGSTAPAIVIFRPTEQHPNVLEVRDQSTNALVARIDNRGSFVSSGGLSVGGPVGFNGVAPVARASAIPSPTADVGALKTAVDALRAVVRSVGLTE